MTISRKAFLTGSWKKKAKKVKSKEDYVLAFLKKNQGRAFKAKEINKAVKKCESHVRGMLRKLVRAGLITQDIPYYLYGKYRVPGVKISKPLKKNK